LLAVDVIAVLGVGVCNAALIIGSTDIAYSTNIASATGIAVAGLHGAVVDIGVAVARIVGRVGASVVISGDYGVIVTRCHCVTVPDDDIRVGGVDV